MDVVVVVCIGVVFASLGEAGRQFTPCGSSSTVVISECFDLIPLDLLLFVHIYLVNTCAAKVLHLRDQIQVRLGVADSFMQKRLLMLCSDKNKGNALSGLMRRALQDATNRFEAAELNRTHHLGYIDLTKYGRLSAVDVNEVGQWSYQLLSQNPDFSILTDLLLFQKHVETDTLTPEAVLRYDLHALPSLGWRRSYEWTPRRVQANRLF